MLNRRLRKTGRLLVSVIVLAMLAGCGNSGNDYSSNDDEDSFSLPGKKPGVVSEEDNTDTTEDVEEVKPEDKTEEKTEDKAEDKNEDKTEEKIEDKTEETTEAANGSSTVNAAAQKFTISEKQMKEYLDGDWQLLETGDKIIDLEAPVDLLSFNSKEGTACFSNGGDNGYMDFTFELSDVFESIPNTNNLLCLTGTDVTDKYISYESSIVGTTSHYQIFIASNGTNDALMLKEIGNGDSPISEAAFGNDRSAVDRVWVFERYFEDEDDYEPKLDMVYNLYADLRKTNATFYAMVYTTYGDCYFLQEVALNPETIQFYDEPEEVYSFNYADGEYPLACVQYYVKDGMMYATSGYYYPVLVEVKTDEEGQITSMTALDEYGYGYYRQSMNGAGPDDRDENEYSDTDSYFLGYWYDKEYGTGNMNISEADVQTGGYRLDFNFYGLSSGYGYANRTEDGGLEINQGYVNDIDNFKCKLERTEAGIRITVTESDFNGFDVGDTYDFVKKTEDD